MPMAGPMVLVIPALQYVHHGAPPLPPLDQSLITAHNRNCKTKNTSASSIYASSEYEQGRVFRMLTYIRPNQANYILSQVQKCKMLKSLPIFTKFLRGPKSQTGKLESLDQAQVPNSYISTNSNHRFVLHTHKQQGFRESQRSRINRIDQWRWNNQFGLRIYLQGFLKNALVNVGSPDPGDTEWQQQNSPETGTVSFHRRYASCYILRL